MDGIELYTLTQLGYLLANVQAGPWTTYTPAWTSSGTAPAIGNGTITGSYMLIGKTCTVRAALNFGSTTTFGTGIWLVSLPFTAKNNGSADTHVGSVYGFESGVNNFTGAVTIGAKSLSATAAQFVTNATSTGWGPTVPTTWTAASTNYFAFTLTYETT